ncbi:nitroreductase [Phytohabitans sp. LJ34]|uniref:nitroreductase n=1 Tax=Phytohabitans sp. LJ34 TaxID=3452217 RepID=UPI003F8BEBCF
MATNASAYPTDVGADTPTVTEALAVAVAAAGLAPSFHHVPPWRWHMTGDGLDLHVEPSRLSDLTDPDARLAILSCGAALHHARVSLAAQGWRATVTRIPDSARPEHLARLQADGPAPTPIEALTVRRGQTIGVRHTDQRPLSGRRIGPDELTAIITAVHAEGSLLHVLYPDQVRHLAAVPSQPAWATVRDRDFGHDGEQHLSAGYDRSALFAILYDRGDQPLNWLRAGEALSAAWLTATEVGVSLLPLSATAEMVGTRQAIRTLLTRVGHPYLVLRLGTIDQDDAGQAHAPQQPIDRIFEVS